MLFDGPPSILLSEEHKKRLRKIAWDTASKLVVSFAGAMGAKVGERFVEWVLGDGQDEDDGGDDEESEE